MKLGRYFTLQEMTYSATASRRGLKNNPSEQHIQNLRNLVVLVLDPLRSLLGKPIKVSSGYRSPAVNAAVGGASNSQHISGNAADLTTGSLDYNRKLLGILLENAATIPFDQAIAEKCDKGGCPSWIHISWRPDNPRKQILFR